MSGLIVIGIGLILCLAGVRFLRIAIALAGFGAAWLIADAFSASTITALLIGAAGALAGLVLSITLKKFVFMIGGGLIGAVVGAKLFNALSFGVDAPALSVVIVALTAVVCAFMAQRGSTRVLMLGTSLGGSALVLSGLGMLSPRSLGVFNHPEDVPGSLLLTLAWLGLAIVSWRFQVSSGADRSK